MPYQMIIKMFSILHLRKMRAQKGMLREIRFYPPKSKVKSPTSSRYSSLKGRIEPGSRDMWALSTVEMKHWESMRSPGQ